MNSLGLQMTSPAKDLIIVQSEDSEKIKKVKINKFLQTMNQCTFLHSSSRKDGRLIDRFNIVFRFIISSSGLLNLLESLVFLLIL